jgi:peroxiredoxin
MDKSSSERSLLSPATAALALALSICILLPSGGCKPDNATAAEDTTANVGIRVGNRAPDFTLTCLDGNTRTLSSSRGKKVMLNFWASWCGPCQVEAPYLKAIYDQYAKDDLIVLTIDMAFNDSAVNVQKFLNKYGLTAPVLLDLDGMVSETYAANFIPLTYFIDKHGIIRSIKHGPFFSQDEIEKILDQLQ